MTTVEQRQAERDRAGVMFVEIAHTAHAIKRLSPRPCHPCVRRLSGGLKAALSIGPVGIGRGSWQGCHLRRGRSTLATTPITSELSIRPAHRGDRISPTLIIAGLRQEVLNDR